MLFIGGGALLWQAADHAARAGHTVDAVCCPPGDAAIPKLQRSGLPVVPMANLDTGVPPLLARSADRLLLSVNNRRLLSDALLAQPGRFFNIHGGLTQAQRGLAECCVCAALCQGDARYGVTLHRLAPGQPVDGGAVVDQIDWALGPDDGFAQVMTQVVRQCQALLVRQLDALVAGTERSTELALSPRPVGPADLEALLRSATPERRARALALGPYAAFFPRLQALRAHWATPA